MNFVALLMQCQVPTRSVDRIIVLSAPWPTLIARGNQFRCVIFSTFSTWNHAFPDHALLPIFFIGITNLDTNPCVEVAPWRWSEVRSDTVLGVLYASAPDFNQGSQRFSRPPRRPRSTFTRVPHGRTSVCHRASQNPPVTEQR